MGVIVNSFTEFSLTDDEKMAGFVFNDMQLRVLQNECSGIAQQLISMKIDLKNPGEFAMDQSHLQGQLEILETLIQRSNETAKLLATL